MAHSHFDLLAAFVFCLQHFVYLQYTSFICKARFYLQRFFFVCSVLFLFAAYFFCLQRSFFVCSVSFLFAAYFFYLQRSFFVCSVSFLFAAFRFCLQRFFFVCSLSLVGHRTYYYTLLSTNLPVQFIHEGFSQNVKRKIFAQLRHARCVVNLFSLVLHKQFGKQTIIRFLFLCLCKCRFKMQIFQPLNLIHVIRVTYWMLGCL